METLSTQIIMKTLDGLSARATVTAENIANAGTRGYRPLAVSFESALKAAVAGGDHAVATVSPVVTRVLPGDTDGRLRLDLELATASSTALRYAALVDLLNRQMQCEAVAISGGS